MVAIVSLWLPIVLAAVAVFLVSSAMHTVLGYHWNDYRAVPNQAGRDGRAPRPEASAG